MITPILCFIFGLFVGSFLNVLIDRIPRNESFLVGRSHCEFCNHTLSARDLVPIFSFVFLKGRCRYCKKFFGWKFPAIELITATSYFLVSFFTSQNTMTLLYSLIFTSAIIVIFFTDLWYGIIPDIILFPISILTLVYVYLFRQAEFLPNLLTGLICFSFFLGLYLITRRRGIGFGDVKLSFLIGLLLGFPAVVTGLYAAFLTGAIVSLILVVWGRKNFFGGSIPFGPFLILGMLIALLFSKTLISILFPNIL